MSGPSPVCCLNLMLGVQDLMLGITGFTLGIRINIPSVICSYVC